jgi:EAL domain-containing protein (putative c-di-GMP-specific phosphodiesterase class I)
VLRLLRAAAGVGIAPAFQPIVSLPDGHIVGYEALARWPSLGELPPEVVVAYAQASGLLATLDYACITSAVAHHPSLVRARRRFDVVFELTERRLLAHPRALLHKIADLRADGIAVALDDVGSHPDSTALLDVVQPDVVKLDMRLLDQRPQPAQARTIAAVFAYQERSGATVVAEGVETDLHLEQALALGASLAQGFRFGRPGPLLTDAPLPRPRQRRVPGLSTTPRSLFDVVAGRAPIRLAHTETLRALSRAVAAQAEHAADPPIVLTAVRRHYSAELRARYQRMAATSALVAVFAPRPPDDVGIGVRGVGLDPLDPLNHEWALLALGPHFAGAVIARDHDPQRVALTVTYDRALVVELARNLMERIA